jgi:hypothetical protein
MPKLFVHAPQGTFTAEARSRVAAALTDLGITCERLADTAKVRAGVWVFFTEHAPDAVFSGGQIAQNPLIALVANTLEQTAISCQCMWSFTRSPSSTGHVRTPGLACSVALAADRGFVGISK